jgi:hypothetical protein
MKNKLATSLLSFGLALSLLVGCGSTTNTTTSNDNVETTTSGKESSQEKASNEIDCGDIVFYYTLPEYPEYSDGFNEYEFEPVDHEVIFSTTDTYPIYNIEGFKVGYIKSGADISIEAKEGTSVLRIENPYDVVDYDYLYTYTWDAMECGTISDAYTYEEYWALVDDAIEKLYEERVELRKSFLEENPDKEEYVPEVIKPIRVDSMDGLEFYTESAPSLMKEDCTEDRINQTASSYFDRYEKYYIEIIRYDYGYLDYNLYIKPLEN